MEIIKSHGVQWLIQTHFKNLLEKQKLRFYRKYPCENKFVVPLYFGVLWICTFHLKEMLSQNVLIKNGTSKLLTGASLWSSLVSIIWSILRCSFLLSKYMMFRYCRILSFSVSEMYCSQWLVYVCK